VTPVRKLATDNDDYRGIQVRLSERELEHMYGLRVTRPSAIDPNAY